jgi:hypothetical protein
MLDGAGGMLVAIWLYPKVGLDGVLIGSSLGSLFLIPLIGTTLASISARSLAAVWIEVWRVLPWIGTSALLLSLASWTENWILLFIAALCVMGLSIVWLLTRISPLSIIIKRLIPRIPQTLGKPSTSCHAPLTTRSLSAINVSQAMPSPCISLQGNFMASTQAMPPDRRRSRLSIFH